MNAATQNRARRANAQKGFSLIEILIVVALIAGIMGLVATQVFGGRSRANVRLAESQLAGLAGKIENFEMDTGALPQRLEDLVTEPGNAKGWLGPYARQSDFSDPWNTPIEYRVPGEGAPFTLISYGDDKKPGGSGVDKDLSSAE
jgi:general secretion pathway protein G